MYFAANQIVSLKGLKIPLKRVNSLILPLIAANFPIFSACFTFQINY